MVHPVERGTCYRAFTRDVVVVVVVDLALQSRDARLQRTSWTSMSRTIIVSRSRQSGSRRRSRAESTPDSFYLSAASISRGKFFASQPRVVREDARMVIGMNVERINRNAPCVTIEGLPDAQLRTVGWEPVWCTSMCVISRMNAEINQLYSELQYGLDIMKLGGSANC